MDEKTTISVRMPNEIVQRLHLIAINHFLVTSERVTASYIIRKLIDEEYDRLKSEIDKFAVKVSDE